MISKLNLTTNSDCTIVLNLLKYIRPIKKIAINQNVFIPINDTVKIIHKKVKKLYCVLRNSIQSLRRWNGSRESTNHIFPLPLVITAAYSEKAELDFRTHTKSSNV